MFVYLLILEATWKKIFDDCKHGINTYVTLIRVATFWRTEMRRDRNVGRESDWVGGRGRGWGWGGGGEKEWRVFDEACREGKGGEEEEEAEEEEEEEEEVEEEEEEEEGDVLFRVSIEDFGSTHSTFCKYFSSLSSNFSLSRKSSFILFITTLLFLPSSTDIRLFSLIASLILSVSESLNIIWTANSMKCILDLHISCDVSWICKCNLNYFQVEYVWYDIKNSISETKFDLRDIDNKKQQLE